MRAQAAKAATLALTTLLATAAFTQAEIAQRGNLRISVDGKLRPKKLPRTGVAPIAVSVAGKVSTTDGTLQPQLKTIRIDLNRNGRLNYTGLPICRYRRIQPASTKRALSGCRSSLVGRGNFTANIMLAGQEPYKTKGRLLAFNGRRNGKPVLYGQIYAARPFATSFVLVFKVRRLASGTYGTALTTSLPSAMGSWGNLTGLDMTLSRSYFYHGIRRSYLSAGCPAPAGFSGAVFPLARGSFSFEGDKELSSVFYSTCKVRQ